MLKLSTIELSEIISDGNQFKPKSFASIAGRPARYYFEFIYLYYSYQ